jgi:hypothetical protein
MFLCGQQKYQVCLLAVGNDLKSSPLLYVLAQPEMER